MRGRGAPLVVSCEHGGNRVPAGYRHLFRGAHEALASHRGWDPGALPMARAIALALGAPLRYSLTTRLLVDPNRSEGEPELFSEYTAELPASERARLLRRYHRPVRERVRRAAVARLRREGRVVHLGVHTFTPTWEGRVREVDVGVLFDPARPAEARLARAWIAELDARLVGLRVRENEPYAGAADGLTRTLRDALGEGYLGLELEVRHDLAAEGSRRTRRMREAVAGALCAALRYAPPGSQTA